jgi:hypothetical protein
MSLGRDVLWVCCKLLAGCIALYRHSDCLCIVKCLMLRIVKCVKVVTGPARICRMVMDRQQMHKFTHLTWSTIRWCNAQLPAEQPKHTQLRHPLELLPNRTQ